MSDTKPKLVSKEIGMLMSKWHASMNDPIYAVGSFAVAGEAYPDAEVVRAAIRRVDGDLVDAEAGLHEWGPVEVAELRHIRYALSACLGETPDPADAAGAMLSGYMTAALWSSLAEDAPRGGENLDENYSVEDIHPDTVADMKADCEAFLLRCAEAGYDLSAFDPSTVGHDFWLTRHHHGSGFWDGDYDTEAHPKLGDALTEIAQTFPEVNLWADDTYVWQD